MQGSDTGKEMEFGQQSCSDFNFQRYNSFIGNGNGVNNILKNLGGSYKRLLSKE